MKLRHLATTSKNGGCPELYATDADTYLVQGTRVSDSELLGLAGVDGRQVIAVEIPRHLFALAALTAADGAVLDIRRGTFLVAAGKQRLLRG